MAAKTAAEEVREVINLDFSIVIPKGMRYLIAEDGTEGNTVLEMDDGRIRLSLDKPVAFAGKMDFSRMGDRGVIRNFAAGIFIKEYGRDVAQTRIAEEAKFFGICSSKANKEGMTAFVIAAGKGLYQGRVFLPKMTDKERVAWLKDLLATAAQFKEAPGEKAASSRPARNIRHIEEEITQKVSASHVDAGTLPAAEEHAAVAAAEKENLTTVSDQAAPAEQEAGRSTEINETQLPDQTPEAVAADDNLTEEAAAYAAAEAAAYVDFVSDEQELDASELTQAAKIEAPAERTVEMSEAAAAEEAASSPAEEPQTPSLRPVPEAPAQVLTEEEKMIRDLENQRREKIASLRKRFSGNLEVENQLDNYIAKVERTAGEITENFRTFLKSVQEYAATARFTGPDDPSYLEMTSQIREAQGRLGQKLDELVLSVDDNGTRVMEAGVTEGSVERIVRLMDRMDRKYHDFALRLNEEERMSYIRPATITALFRKWQNILGTLPSYIEEADARREKEIGDDLAVRLEAARTKIGDQQVLIERLKGEVTMALQEAHLADRNIETFDKSFESRQQEVREAGEKERAQEAEKVTELEKERKDKLEEVARLTEELSRTFALNVNRKKQLNTQIEAANSEAEAIQGKITTAKEEVQRIDKKNNGQLKALDAEREALVSRRDQFEQNRQDLEAQQEEAQAALDELHRSIEDMEYESRHLHENYLLGKYDINE